MDRRNEGKGADQFGPGTHVLTTQTLPVPTNLRNWACRMAVKTGFVRT